MGTVRSESVERYISAIKTIPGLKGLCLRTKSFIIPNVPQYFSVT